MLVRSQLRPLGAKAIKVPSSLVRSSAGVAPQAQHQRPLSPPSLLQQQQQQQQQQRRQASSTSTNSASTSTSTTTTSTTKPNSKVIFSGIQPTGVPHLGNYLGALKQWVHLQNTASPDTKLLFSVVDLHAITAPPATGANDAAKLMRKRRRETLAALMAIGLDPERSILFYQSSCSAHSELMWILSCMASMGYLSRMTQWKSKLSLSQDTEALDEDAKTKLKLGLFSYPVLQAADIMVHGATHVPVGDDQKQHIEFTRECAKNFNHTYGTSILVPPETILSPARRVMSLQNPTAKMSKSDTNHKSRIGITDDAQMIRTRIKAALTDSQPGPVTYDPVNRPGVANLLELLSILHEEPRTPADIVAAEGGFEGDENNVPLKLLKNQTADAIIRELEDVRERYLDFLEVKGAKWLDDVAQRGAEKANANALKTMKRVKDAVGL